MDRKEVAWQILCSKRAIAYLVDISTHEIKFLSPAALDLCKIGSEEELKDRTCYRVIHGLDAPCEFCSNDKLETEGVLRWQFYSSHLKCWANAEDHFLTIEGREYRLEILEDLSVEKKELELKARQLELEKTMVRCIELLAYEEDTDVAIAEFLSTIGSYYDADRVYIIEYSKDANTCSSTFEWCRTGVEPQMKQLKNISLDMLKTCNGKFLSEGEFYVSLDDQQEESGEEDYRFVKMKEVHSFGAVPFLQDGRVIGFLGVDNPTRCINEWMLIRSVSSFVRDELRMRRLSRSLEIASHTDALTGIGNRYLYQERISKLQEKQPATLGIAVVDINGLKTINDKLGHYQGDKAIIHTGQVMQKFFENAAYRVGGDEFVILCADIGEQEFLDRIAQMRAEVEAGHQYSISVGTVWKDCACVLESEISFADELMYTEKQKYYSEAVKNGRHARVGVANGLLTDIQNGRYVVYLQPQYDLQTRRIIGAEALVRKLDDDGSLILPGKFIPQYEEEGIIRHIDFFVLQTVCRKLREWKAAGTVIPVAINFSRVTFMEPQIGESILEVCREYGVDPACVKLEMTESISKIGEAALKKLLQDIEQAGLSVSLDDFGYAYSNLSLAAEYEFPEIKLDMSMVSKLGKNPRIDVIVRNSIDAINSLGAMSVAEGIETKEQLERLVAFGCRAGQGFYFSRPVPLENFEVK